MSDAQTGTAEEQARSNGWLPQEEYKGDSGNWVSAGEFNKRGELLGTIIKEQRRNKAFRSEINELRDAMKDLGEHNAKVAESARKQVIEELKGLKKEALQDGDADTVIDVDEKLLEIKAEELKETTKVEPQGTPEGQEILNEWAEDNDWYTDKPLLAASMDAQLAMLVRAKPSLKNDPEEALRLATEAIKEEFPEQFDTDAGTRKTRQAVLGKTGKAPKGGGNTNFSAASLSHEQRTAAQRIINSGAPITLDQYAEQLGEMGEL